MNTIQIYTDGSCIGNPGPGGWAFLVLPQTPDAPTIKQSGREPNETTNNRMEMMAIIKALTWLKENIPTPQLKQSHIQLHSDSNLIIQTLNQGWKRKANTDLWFELEAAAQGLTIEWKWVKAHAKNAHNNMVDALAFKQANNKA